MTMRTGNNLIIDFPRTPRRLSSSSSSSSSSSKTKQLVRFSSMSELYTYPNDTTTDNEADTNSAIWYTSEDQQRFRRDAKDDASSYLTKRATKQAEAKRTDLPVDHIEPPPFGLELQLVSKEHTQKRVMTRQLVLIAVLTEQERQYEETAYSRAADGYDDDDHIQERIAAISRKYSKWSRDEARVVGRFQASASI